MRVRVALTRREYWDERCGILPSSHGRWVFTVWGCRIEQAVVEARGACEAYDIAGEASEVDCAALRLLGFQVEAA
jgi:hypothetical protein